MKSRILFNVLITSLAALSFTFSAGAQVTVLAVPFDPTNPTTPHTTYPASATTEATIVLGATVPSAVGSKDSFTYQWSFGDGTSSTAKALTNAYDISVTHQYPASAATGTQWTATVTATDTTSNQTGTAKYYVIQEANNLSSRVNVAIDRGLWYLHQTMWRSTTKVGTTTVPWGGWDGQSGALACPSVNGDTYSCISYASIDAENVQAFEVNSHFQNGPSTDPYTEDVSRGIARALTFIATMKNATDTYTYNPATAVFTCADGSIPQTTDKGACTGHGGQYFYNPNATSCTKPPCVVTFDGNSDGLMAYSNDGSGEYIYTTAPFVDMLVASGTPAATANTGQVIGMTYQNIIQDMLDWYAYGQYGDDYDVAQGYVRGGGYSAQGGGWLYSPQTGDDNSTSQWAAISLISGQRGSGISIPAIVTDANQVWITNAQDVQDKAPTKADPFSSGDNYGAFGYRGSFYYSNAWGPFAVTPSGAVQMAMDGIGRTPNKAFGDSSTAFDQRWNNTETFYADNFCNTVSPYNQAYYAPRAYLYGMYSFTKGMLLHNVNGSLAPIQYLRTQTPNVFTTNSNVPANTIDWYAAVSSANGGSDPCDGVAQTLVDYQLKPAFGVSDGHWFGNDYDGYQFYYETAWALIMLQRTVFVTCVNNLSGQGSASGASPARIDLSWSNQANSTSYDVLRSGTSGGPYTQIGTTTTTSYSDTSGLTDGQTYFYVIQPVNGSAEVCQSNQATVTVPVPSGRH